MSTLLNIHHIEDFERMNLRQEGNPSPNCISLEELNVLQRTVLKLRNLVKKPENLLKDGCK
jgi:hypothetical protein